MGSVEPMLLLLTLLAQSATPKPTTTVPPPTTPEPCRPGEMWPYEGTCARFYMCKRGVGLPMICPVGMYFNPSWSICAVLTEDEAESCPDIQLIKLLETTTRKPAWNIIQPTHPVTIENIFAMERNQRMSQDEVYFDLWSVDDLEKNGIFK